MNHVWRRFLNGAREAIFLPLAESEDHNFSESASDTWPPKKLALALQGGGSFGAFTWGILDRLLDEPNLQLDMISGASAGAVNAVLLASGLMAGRQAAKRKLHHFWRNISKTASFLPLSAMAPGLQALTRSLSPYQFNPFNLNPLREILAKTVDFPELSKPSATRLLIAATRVTDGKLHIFRNEELSVDTVLASACLPMIHQSVAIDDETFWDGGYAANPPFLPLVRESSASTFLVVQITPSKNLIIPKSQKDIAKRLDQINFNASLHTEIAALKYFTPMIRDPRLANLRIDCLSAENEYETLNLHHPADLDWVFLLDLRDSGQRAADLWLRGGMRKSRLL